MARIQSKLSAGTVVLDSEGLSLWCASDKRVTAIIDEAQRNDFRIIVSALTPIEAFNIRVKNDQLKWYLSRIVTEPVTDEVSFFAMNLLSQAGLHGHQHAIDAVVAATALRAIKPTIMLTSDPDDMASLCGKLIRIVKL